MKLTAKQEKFCQNIVAGMNQSDAFRDAYETAKKRYTPQQIWVEASELAAKPNVRRRIEELRAPVAQKAQITAEEIITELKNIAFDKKNKPSDRAKALELLGKYLKIFTERKEIEHSGDLGVIRLPMKLPEGAPVQTEFGEKVEFEGLDDESGEEKN